MAEDEPNSSNPEHRLEPGSRSQAPESTAPELAPDSVGDDRLQRLMKEAFSGSEDAFEDGFEGKVELDVLRGVQQKLRERSGGKFYRDGWSTARHPPFATYFITSLMMLAVIGILYAILTPLVGDPIPQPTEPKPVQLIPPR